MKLMAICDTCRHQHAIDFDPRRGPGAAFSDWLAKHPGHAIDFVYPQRSGNDHAVDHSYMDYLHNADIKVAYASSAALTITLASLATSSTKLAGQEGSAVDNTTNKYLDYLLGGKITVGTTPTTATSIDVCVVGMVDDSTYPDVFDGTDSAETVTSAEIKDAICKPFQTLSVVSTSSDVAQWCGPGSVASRFGGNLPKKFSVFVAHNTGVNLNSTGGNHVLSTTGVYATAT